MGGTPYTVLSAYRPFYLLVGYFETYCTDCNWSASTEEYTSRETIGKHAITHHVESGHTIASRSLAYHIRLD